jgi:hypothetical protein
MLEGRGMDDLFLLKAGVVIGFAALAVWALGCPVGWQ